jgi:hypothetical protein
MFLLLSPLTVDPCELRAHVELICEAAEIPSMEKLALALDMDEGQLNRQLRGEGHLSLTRIVGVLAKQHPQFWSRYAWLLACRFGVPMEAKRAAWLAFGTMGRRRQLKMAAQQPQKRSA